MKKRLGLKNIFNYNDYINIGISLVLLGFVVATACRLYIFLEFLIPIISWVSLIMWISGTLLIWYGNYRKKITINAITTEIAWGRVKRFAREHKNDRKLEIKELVEALDVLIKLEVDKNESAGDNDTYEKIINDDTDD